MCLRVDGIEAAIDVGFGRVVVVVVGAFVAPSSTSSVPASTWEFARGSRSGAATRSSRVRRRRARRAAGVRGLDGLARLTCTRSVVAVTPWTSSSFAQRICVRGYVLRRRRLRARPTGIRPRRAGRAAHAAQAGDPEPLTTRTRTVPGSEAAAGTTPSARTPPGGRAVSPLRGTSRVTRLPDLTPRDRGHLDVGRAQPAGTSARATSTRRASGSDRSSGASSPRRRAR